MRSPLKMLAAPLSAMYQHLFPNEGNKFCSKVAVKDSQDCNSIIPLHQRCPIRGPRATCGPRKGFECPAGLFRNYHIINLIAT